MSNPKEVLELKIRALDELQKQELLLLKEDIRGVLVSLSPFEIIKNAIAAENTGESLGSNPMADLIGMSTGILSNKLTFGSTTNPFKKLIGSLLQFAVAKFVANNSAKIHAIGEVLVKRITANPVENENQENTSVRN